MENKTKYVYVTHKIKSEYTDKLEELSQLTGKSKAELIEEMIEEMYDNLVNSNKVTEDIEDDEMFDYFSDSTFEEELKNAEQRWKNSNQGLNDFNQRMEDWKMEEKRRNKKQAEEIKRKLDESARAWEEYFRNYSSSKRKNKPHTFKYFNPNDGAEVWKKQMRQYTRQWHPDYAQNDGNPYKFGEMKAEYDILTGRIPSKEYSL